MPPPKKIKSRKVMPCPAILNNGASCDDKKLSVNKRAMRIKTANTKPVVRACPL